MFEILRDIPRNLPFLSYGTILGYGGDSDEVDRHGEKF